MKAELNGRSDRLNLSINLIMVNFSSQQEDSMEKKKRIKDPDAKNPEDWDEREMIEDLEEKKPADWDQLEHFPGPDVKKPDDGDEEMDGEWEPLMISNLDYKEAEKKTKVQED
ncbi:calreticulin-like [Mauremys mutica]|uniref:calreticulin-like n=1 Tax=Mauremys mutica TaxID=74926 RepID=UPI001D16DFD8|nr:calreticulin-like [Mauremys mutica]